MTYARKQQKPVTIVYKNVPRRFGHAATDRQSAYLSPEEIQVRSPELAKRWNGLTQHLERGGAQSTRVRMQAAC